MEVFAPRPFAPSPNLTNFCAPFSKESPFFLFCGVTPLQNPRRTPAPEYCIFSRKRRSFEVRGRGGIQEGRGRWGGGKKKEKRTRKKCSVTTFWKLPFSGSLPELSDCNLNAQSRLFYREIDCPMQWSLATPSALESQSRANQGSLVANPICKCRCHKAGHLQVRVAVGMRSTCVLKEAPLLPGPLDKGPLGFPQKVIFEAPKKSIVSEASNLVSIIVL